MQLDAYRFGQRRLDSALALRDPVLLHERIRTQGRVVAIGLVLATLIGAAMVGYVKFTHSDAWQAQSVIVSMRTNQMYVVIHQPDRLVPVRNLAAARLVIGAAAEPKSGVAGLVGETDPASLEPTRLDESALLGAHRTVMSAVTGAPDTALPDGETELAAPMPWALCAGGDGTTTLIANPAPTRVLGPDEAVVVVGGSRHYLVTGGHKYLIGPAGAAAYDLKDAMVSAPVMAAAQLALIPDARLGSGALVELTALSLRISGGAADTRSQPARVVRVQRSGQADRYYLVAHGGVSPVSAPVAKLIRVGLAEDTTQPAPLWTVEAVNSLPTTALEWVKDYPDDVAVVPPGPASRVLCWRWDASGRHPELTLAPAPPIRAEQPPVVLAQSDGAEPNLDQVSLPGGVVIAATAVAGSRTSAPNGNWLVSATGVAYPIATTETARALGIRSAVPVPVEALTALPRGDQLDLAEAGRTVDGYRESPVAGG
jgi:type VII secretion protein EccB